MKCDNCGRENKEVAVFNKNLFGVLPFKVRVCQRCVSNAFRNFVKGK